MYRYHSVFIVAILTTMFAAASSVVLAADASPEPGASPVDASPGAETIYGWPFTEAEPAGLYSWTPVSVGRRWMHKVPESYTASAPNSVELTFYAAPPPGLPESISNHAVWRGWSEDGPFDQPARVGDVRTETWLLDVDDDMRVAILLDSYPDTDPALLAEARAVIESIVVKPIYSGHRLVFRLMEGWDSG